MGSYLRTPSPKRDLGRNEEEAGSREALRVNPHYAATHIDAGNALSDLRRFAETFINTGGGETSTWRRRSKEAAAAYRKALRVDPDNAYAHTGLGNALGQLGRHEEAVAAYREALRVDPDNVAAHTGLGNALGQLGRHEEAVAAYREALRVDPAQPFEGVVDILLKHEQEYWRKTAEARHLDYQPETLRNAVAAASLTGATQPREALATLTRVPGLRDQAEDRLVSVASWLHDLYPSTEDQYWGSLQPDRLAEHLVGRIARFDPDFIVQLLAGASDAQKYRAFHILDRAAGHQPHLVDVWSPLERIVRVHGDNPSGDAAVRQELLQPGSILFALGALTGDAAGAAHLLHCTVPVGEETIAMLPVFTRIEHVLSAVAMNPAWQSLQVLQMEAHVVLGDLEEGEWLGINPWSGKEFKLPAASLSSDLGRNEEEEEEEEEEAGPREPSRVDPHYAAAHAGLGDALRDLRRFAATYVPTVGEASAGQRLTEEAAAYREAIRVDPDNAAAHAGLGKALNELTRHAEAANAYREALRVDPDNAAAHTGLGDALISLGRLAATFTDTGDGEESTGRAASRRRPPPTVRRYAWTPTTPTPTPASATR